MPVLYCFDYCSFGVLSEVREPDSSSSVFLSQDCFGYLESFVFPYNKIVFSSAVKNAIGASLVAQWLRVHLLIQGTWVRAPVREDLTCHGAARPVSHGH